MKGGADLPGEDAEKNSIFSKLVLDRTKKDYLLGIGSLLETNREAAAVRFRLIMERDDLQPDALFALALCTNDPQEQLESIDRTLRLRSRFTRLSKEAGIALCATFDACDGRRLRLMNDEPGLEILASEVFQSHGKLDDAWRLLNGSQHADVDLFRFSRGEVLLRLRRYEEAIDVLKRLNANPTLAAPAYYLMGLALEQLGYHTTAIQIYRGCLRGETMSRRLEAAIRNQMITLLEREDKQWLAKRERARLAAIQAELKGNNFSQ
jgi:tetratricopeptide (TPR) repeat protein